MASEMTHAHPFPAVACWRGVWRSSALLALLLAPAVALAQPQGALAGRSGAATQARSEVRTLEIVQAQRLELRKLDGQELIIMSGQPVRLQLGSDEIEAERIEYNRTERTLTLSGNARYRTSETTADGTVTPQLLTGEQLVVNLATQNLGGEEVIVSSGGLEIRGEEVQRVPGQLQASSGYVTPCAGCGQTPNDYALKATSLILYPGDRLVMRGVTVLLADQPVFYLPTLVVFLNDPDRRPRLELSESERDGRTLLADLPFVIGAGVAGTTMLRFYQKRTPTTGFGVDLRAYAPAPAVDRLDLRVMADPRPVGQEGRDIDIEAVLRGGLEAGGSQNGLDYRFAVTRRDSGRTEAEKGVAQVTGSVQGQFAGFGVRLEYNDRFGPPVQGRLGTVLRRPELLITPDELREGNLRATVRAGLGVFEGATNDVSFRARNQDNLTVARAELTGRASYNASPWSGASLSASGDYTGRLYSTQTAGQATRVVDYTFGARLSQRLGESSVALSYNYFRREGTSPLQFDRLSGQRLEATGGLSLAVNPTAGLGLSLSQNYNFMLPSERQTAANFGLTVNRDPLQVRARFARNLFSGLPESSSLEASLGSTSVGPLVAIGLGYNAQGGLSPATLRAEYRASAANSATLRATYSFGSAAQSNQPPLPPRFTALTATLNAVGGTDEVLNPVTLAVTQNIFLDTPRVSGDYRLRWRKAEGALKHDLTLGEAGDTGRAGNLNVELGSLQGAATAWRLSYGGAYRLGQGFANPLLRASLSSTRGTNRVSGELDYVFSGYNQLRATDNTALGLVRATATANWDIGSRVGVSGNVAYNRSGQGASQRESLAFTPLNFTFAIGENERPDVYATLGLRQTLTWRGGEPVGGVVIAPILSLIADRCCWALRAEINPVERFVRFSINLPSAGGGPAFEVTPEGPRFPGLSVTPP